MDNQKLIKKTDWLLLALIVLAFVFSLYYSTKLPAIVPVHWDAQGQVNGYGPKWLNLYLLPVITLAIFLLMTFIPKIDPFQKNYQKFARAYEGLKAVLVVFFLFLYGSTLYASINPSSDIMANFLGLGFGLLMVVLGYLMPQLKRNWFAGIKTPWTLSSELSWEKTHALAGKLFMAAGLLTISANFIFPSYVLAVMVVSILMAAFVPVAYSYFVWKSDPDKKELKL